MAAKSKQGQQQGKIGQAQEKQAVDGTGRKIKQ
jgi:hypothetical protein